MALIYRWNADMNPLHSDPAIAKAAGYPRPILHGPATFGVAGHAILKTMCGYDPARFKSIPGGSPRRSIRAKRSAPRCGATGES
jgi:acyl dehydratase